MDTETYKAITNTNQAQIYSNFIKHFILNYVDDSSNVVSSHDPKCLQNYINDFFRLLENFYNANRLTINRDKSKLLITCKNKLRNSSKNIKLQASEYTISQSDKIKVLGIFITTSLNNQATINNIISKVNYRSSVLKNIFKYSSLRTKRILSTSIIISTFRYAAPLLIDSTQAQLRSLQTLLIRCTRPIFGFES